MALSQRPHQLRYRADLAFTQTCRQVRREFLPLCLPQWAIQFSIQHLVSILKSDVNFDEALGTYHMAGHVIILCNVIHWEHEFEPTALDMLNIMQIYRSSSLLPYHEITFDCPLLHAIFNLREGSGAYRYMISTCTHKVLLTCDNTIPRPSVVVFLLQPNWKFDNVQVMSKLLQDGIGAQLCRRVKLLAL